MLQHTDKFMFGGHASGRPQMKISKTGHFVSFERDFMYHEKQAWNKYATL